jgi:hypothetical protein
MTRAFPDGLHQGDRLICLSYSPYTGNVSLNLDGLGTRLHGEVMADIAGLRDEVRQNHAAVMAQFEKLQAKPTEN